MAKKTSRPEVFRRAAEMKSAHSGSHYKFPDKPYPHTILLVFKEYSYENLKNGNYSATLNNNAFTDGFALNRSSGVSLRTEPRAIELPFPKQLADNTNLMINGFSRDPMVETLANKAADFASTGGNLGDIPQMIQRQGQNLARILSGSSGAASGVNSVASTISSMGIGDAASTAAYLVRSMIGSAGDIGKSVDLATGQVLNPRETLAFEGVQLRQHQFEWELYPSNSADSSRIKDIVNVMKRSVLPVTQDLGSGAAAIAKAFLRYPHVCEIYLLGVDKEHFMKFKPSFVTNLSVDYGAGGTLGIMKGGKPAGVSISLQLQELQIETAEDYGQESATAAPVAEFQDPVQDGDVGTWTNENGEFIGP